MVTTIVNGNRRVTLPDDVRVALGLEDGAEYVIRPSAVAPADGPSSVATFPGETVAAMGQQDLPDERFVQGRPLANQSRREDRAGGMVRSQVEREDSSDADGHDTTTEQRQAMERAFGSLSAYRRAPDRTDDDWDDTIAQAVVEDFRSEDYGTTDGRGT